MESSNTPNEIPADILIPVLETADGEDDVILDISDGLPDLENINTPKLVLSDNEFENIKLCLSSLNEKKWRKKLNKINATLFMKYFSAEFINKFTKMEIVKIIDEIGYYDEINDVNWIGSKNDIVCKLNVILGDGLYVNVTKRQNTKAQKTWKVPLLRYSVIEF